MILNKQIQNALKELKDGLVKLYGNRLKGVYVFGSYARGTQQPASDIDVAFVLDSFDKSWPEIERTSKLVSKLSLELEVTISLIPVRETDLQDKFGLLARSIAREGIAV